MGIKGFFKKLFLLQVIFLLLPSLGYSLGPLVEISCQLSPAGSFKATTSELHGVIQSDGKKYWVKQVWIPLKSLKTGIALRDKHMLQHFQADKFPYAIFKNGTGENGKGKGDLTIRDVTKSVEIDYIKKDQKYLEGKFNIKISDFKIEEAKYMGVGVEDEVEVTVDLPYQVGSANGKK